MQTHWFADGLALYNYNCREVLPVLADASVDSVVTDPQYGLAEHKPEVVAKALAAWLSGDRDHVPDGRGFMGKEWDKFVPPPAMWDECYRVLKPGGYLVAFSAPRTADLLGISIRLAGFEIRDSLHWIAGSGFPKSLNVAKAIDKHMAPGELDPPVSPEGVPWTGFGSALKPAHEPIVLARKPLAGTVAQNVLTHGTGALNVDGCRVDGAGAESGRVRHGGGSNGVYAQDEWTQANQATMGSAMPAGRWPPNVLLTHAADCDGQCAPGCPVAGLDGQSGNVKGPGGPARKTCNADGDVYGNGLGPQGPVYPGQSGGASRFFPQLNWSPEYDLPFLYQAKASAKERPRHADGTAHPTVKPLALMRWLARLVTPPGGTVLDPFCGTGTTLQAARLEGFRSIGCDSWDQAAEMACQRLGLVVEADAG